MNNLIDIILKDILYISIAPILCFFIYLTITKVTSAFFGEDIRKLTEKAEARIRSVINNEKAKRSEIVKELEVANFKVVNLEKRLTDLKDINKSKEATEEVTIHILEDKQKKKPVKKKNKKKKSNKKKGKKKNKKKSKNKFQWKLKLISKNKKKRG